MENVYLACRPRKAHNNKTSTSLLQSALCYIHIKRGKVSYVNYDSTANNNVDIIAINSSNGIIIDILN